MPDAVAEESAQIIVTPQRFYTSVRIYALKSSHFAARRPPICNTYTQTGGRQNSSQIEIFCSINEI